MPQILQPPYTPTGSLEKPHLSAPVLSVKTMEIRGALISRVEDSRARGVEGLFLDIRVIARLVDRLLRIQGFEDSRVRVRCPGITVT